MEAGHAPTLLFMYLPDADQAGHGGGPESERVSNALVRLDTFVGDLRAEIAHRNMSHIVDLVVVSDHGMAALSEKRIMFLDDILGDKYSDITHKDGKSCPTVCGLTLPQDGRRTDSGSPTAQTTPRTSLRWRPQPRR